MDTADFRVIGHRGACGYATENTLASFSLARELGCRWVEFDVQDLVDGELVVFHDRSLWRMAGKRKIVSSMRAEDVQAVNLKNDDKIPTLRETLKQLVSDGVGAYVEIKTANIKCVSKIIGLIEESGITNIVSSFHKPILDEVRATGWKGETMALLEDTSLKSWRWAVDHPEIGVSRKMSTHKTTLAASQNHGRVFCYTVNTEREALVLRNVGFSGVFTDYPDLISPIQS